MKTRVLSTNSYCITTMVMVNIVMVAQELWNSKGSVDACIISYILDHAALEP